MWVVGLLVSDAALAAEPPKRVLKQFTERTGCAQVESSAQLDDGTEGWKTYKVIGCGQELFVSKFRVLVHDDLDLRKAAAFDLGCAIDQLEVTYLTYRTRGVTGCGVKVRYVATPSGWVTDQASNQAPAPVTPEGAP